MKKIILYIIILLLALTKVASSQVATIQTVNGTYGSTQVDVTLSAFTSSNAIGAITMKIGFDPNVASFTGITHNLISSGIIANAVGNEIIIAWSNTPAVSVNGVGFRLNFNYTGGGCYLTFNQGCEITNGSGVIIQTTYSNGEIKQPILTTTATIATQSGVYNVVNELPVSFSGFPTFPPESQVSAINLNISYNNNTLQFVGISGLSGAIANAANGVISIAWSNSTPVNLNAIPLKLLFNYLGGSSSVSFTGTNIISNANGVQVPVSLTNGGIAQPVTSDTVVIGNVEGQLIGSTTVPVTFKGFSGNNPGAFTMNIAYNSSALNFTGTSGLSGLVANASNGVISLTWYNSSGFAISGFNLLFNYIGGSSNIQFTAQNQITNVTGNLIPVTYINGLVTQPSTPVNVSIGNTALTPGNSTVLVPINLAGITGNVFATTMYVNFDNTKLTYMGVENATTGVIVNQDYTTKTIVISWANTSSSLGNGKFLDLKFTFNGGPGNLDVPVYFTTYNSNASSLANDIGDPVIANWINGFVNKSYSISGILKYANTTGAVRPITNSTVNLKSGGTIVATTTTDAITGNFTLVGIPNGTYTYEVTTTKPWGALGVTIADYGIVRSYVTTGSPVLTGIYLLAADANNSSTVTIADYGLIKNRVNTSSSVGWSGSDWIFVPPVSVIISGSNVSGVVIPGIIRGDVNASYVPPL